VRAGGAGILETHSWRLIPSRWEIEPDPNLIARVAWWYRHATGPGVVADQCQPHAVQAATHEGQHGQAGPGRYAVRHHRGNGAPDAPSFDPATAQRQVGNRALSAILAPAATAATALHAASSDWTDAQRLAGNRALRAFLAPAAKARADMAPASGAAVAAATAPLIDAGLLHQALAAPGTPLDAVQRRHAEQVSAVDLSPVTVHTGAWARMATRAAGAAAFTVRSDIVVGTAPGQLVPQPLLDHELAHAAQHVRGRPGTPEQAERQATALAEHRGEPDGELVSASGKIACAPEDSHGGRRPW